MTTPQLSVQPTLKPLHIHRPQILHKSPLLVKDHRKLHTAATSIPYEGKVVVNVTYSKIYKVYLVLCDDWKLYVYNQNLDLISRLMDWQSRYSVGFQFIQELGIMLLIGVNQIEVMKVAVHSNVLKTKFLSSMKFGIEKKEIKSVKEKDKLGWNKGYGYNISEGLLYVWSSQQINFFSFPKLELKTSIPKLVKKETSLTSVHYNVNYKYTLTGLINGNLKVWRLPTLAISVSQTFMVHNCIKHTKAVDKIVQGIDQRTVMSSALDLTVCLWSLETFQLLRHYNFQNIYSEVSLINSSGALAVENGILGELNFGVTTDFITDLPSSIISLDKRCFPKSTKVDAVQLVLESNIGLQVSSSSLFEKDLNKIDVPYFYPPLKAKSIKQVISNPYNNEVYYMLSENGEFFSVKIQKNASVIQECYNLKHTQDWEGHPINQSPTFIKFMPFVSIEFDSQITDNTFVKKEQNSELGLEQLKLIAVGFSKGTILVLSLNNLDKTRTRLTYHRDHVEAIQFVKTPYKDDYIIVSKCQQDYIRFVKFQNNRADCFLSVQCCSMIRFFKGFQNYLGLVFEKGIFQIAGFKDEKEFLIFQNVQSIDHQGQIYSFDYDPTHKLIVTCASDNYIKIWSVFKELMFEVRLDEGLNYALWVNRLEILIFHRSTLRLLRDLSKQAQLKIFKSMEFLPQINWQLYNIYEIKDYIKTLKKQNQTKQQEKQFATFKRNRINRTLHQNSTFYGKHQTPKLDLSKRGETIEYTNKQKKKSKGAKSKSNKVRVKSNYSAIAKEEESERKKQMIDYNLKATSKHIKQMNQLKKVTNQSLLPKIRSKTDDKFEDFLNNKLLNKKMLTRRDITLNRIIMKNLIKDQFREDQEGYEGLKLDF